MRTVIWYSTSAFTLSNVDFVVKNLRVVETPTENTAPALVQIKRSGKEQFCMAIDYKAALVAYRTSMSLAASLLSDGVITEKEYGQIDRIIAKRHGLNLASICCRIPLIDPENRGNMRHNEGSDADEPDDF